MFDRPESYLNEGKEVSEISVEKFDIYNYLKNDLDMEPVTYYAKNGDNFQSIVVTDKDVLDHLVANDYIKLPVGVYEIGEYEVINKELDVN